MKEETSMDQVFLNRIHSSIMENLANEHFGVDDLASEVGISRSQLHRRLNQLTGQSPSQLMKELRLKRALELLQKKMGTVSDIAYQVGFSSPSYFNTCFKDFYGYSPGKVKPPGSARTLMNKRLARKHPVALISLLVFSVLLILAVFMLIFPKVFRKDRFEDVRDTEGRISIAVMPFENLTGDSALYWFQRGVSSLIINGLGSSPELVVRDDHAMYEVMESMDLVFTAGVSPPKAGEVAEKVHAETYVSGSIHGTGDTYRLAANLTDTEMDDIIWSGKVDGDLRSAEFFSMVDSLCREIKNYLEIKVLEQEADPDFREAFPESSEAYRHYIEGTNSILTRDYESAIQSLKKAWETDTTFTFASLYLAWAYGSNMQFEQGRTWVKKAYAHKDRLPSTYQYLLGLWYAEYVSKNLQDLIRYSQLLERSGISSRVLWFELGIGYYDYLQHYEKAVEAFEKIEEISLERGDDWEYEFFHIFYGRALHKVGNHEKEKEVYETGLELFPENVWMLRDQAICALTQGDTAEANECMTKIITIRKDLGIPEAIIECSDLGRIYEEADLIDKAEVHYRKAFELEPNDFRPNFYLAGLLIEYDINVDEGMELIQKGLEIEPDRPSLLQVKGWGCYKQGKLEEALHYLKLAEEGRMAYIYSLDQQTREVEKAIGKAKN